MDSAAPQNVEQDTTTPQPNPSSSSSSFSSLGGLNMHDEPTRPNLPAARAATFMGKHRMTAAINYLNQQIQILQDELDQLDTIGGSSIVCQELISSIGSVPDALLPETRGPVDVGWERWFQGAQSSRSRRRWI